MALINIPFGGTPKSSQLNSNFTYLEGLITAGKGIRYGDSIATLKAAALAAPTVPFLCIPSDVDALMLYCGKATRGQDADGFITIVSFEAIS